MIVCGNMYESRSFPTGDVDQDEGELNSEEDIQSSSSEGFTTDGDGESDDVNRSDGRSLSVNETPWERGLRLARDRARKAKMLRQTDADLEDKKLNLTVIAPDPTEDATFADVCDMGRSNPSDIFWLNYHKLSIIGSSHLTCKRALPCDLAPPSQNTITQWRKSLAKLGSRSKDTSASSPSSTSSMKRSPSTVSSNFGSRASSLSSLAGSIYLAVPDLLLADDLDREAQRRRRRRRHRSDEGSGHLGSTTGSSLSSRSPSVSSRSSSPKPIAQKPMQRNRGSISISSRSHSRSASHSPYSRNRDRKGSFAGPRIDSQPPRGTRRGPGMYGDQRQPQQSTMPPISGYNHQQTNFDRGSGGGFRDGDNGSSHIDRRSFGDSNRWRESSNRSPDRPPLMPADRPVKRPWVAEPPRPRAVARQRSPPPRQPPPPPPQHQRSRRSRSRPNEELEGSTTYITSWSQPRGRQSASVSKPTPSDTGPLQSMTSPSRKRSAAGSRRKSRSPFADSYFGNPPPPASTGAPSAGEMSVPFEQTVPLLAGAVNPAAPPREMPPVSTRPGVKLTIAPRIRVGGSALDRPPRENPQITTTTTSTYRVAGGSPVSSTSSVGGERRGRSQTRSPPAGSRRGKRGSPLPSKRMRHAAGYIAVSPGGFDSPQRPQRQPPSPPRLYARNRRFDPDEAPPSRMRGRGPNHGRVGDGRHGRGDFQNDRPDRFSRGGAPPPERYRIRRPPPPSSNDRFDRRGGTNDRNPASYDRGRDYMGETHYGRSRGGRVDDDRAFVGLRDNGRRRDSHGGGGAVRSRSPFEDRRRRDTDIEQRFHDSSGSALNTEARLDELRRRLAAVDDKITELGGGNR